MQFDKIGDISTMPNPTGLCNTPENNSHYICELFVGWLEKICILAWL